MRNQHLYAYTRLGADRSFQLAMAAAGISTAHILKRGVQQIWLMPLLQLDKPYDDYSAQHYMSWRKPTPRTACLAEGSVIWALPKPRVAGIKSMSLRVILRL